MTCVEQPHSAIVLGPVHACGAAEIHLPVQQDAGTRQNSWAPKGESAADPPAKVPVFSLSSGNYG